MISIRGSSLLQNQWVGHALRIGLGAAAVYLLIHTGALKPALLGRAMESHPGFFILALALYALPLEGIAFFRWYWLLRAAKVQISMGLVLRLHLIGLFFSGFLPGGTGGDLVKGFYLLRGRDKTEGATAIKTMVVDRFAGTFGLIWLAAITNLMNHRLWEMSRVLSAQIVTVLGMSLASAILVGIYLSPWKPHWLHASIVPETRDGAPHLGFWKGLLSSMIAFRDSPGVFWGVIGLSMTVHLCLVGVYALCAQSLEVDLPFRLHAFVAPTLTLLNGIPISPAGLGIGEAGGAFLYKAVGVTHSRAEIPGLVDTVVLLTALVCAPAYFWQRGAKK